MADVGSNHFFSHSVELFHVLNDVPAIKYFRSIKAFNLRISDFHHFQFHFRFFFLQKNGSPNKSMNSNIDTC